MARRSPLILLSLLLATFLINVDTTIVNVALPTLVRELGASTTQLQWIVDAYNLVFAAFVLAAGSLSDRVGRKGTLLVGLAVFGSASFAGGLGDTPGELIAARCVMGLGAALVFPATLSLLSNIFTERRERARAIGLWGAATGAGVALGPIAGGWLLEHFSWSSVFFALAPVAAVAAALVSLSVPTSRDPRARKADPRGLTLSTLAIALLVFTIIEAPTYGWLSGRSVGGFVGAFVALGAFIAWERQAPEPMLDVSLFKYLRFTAASVSVAIAFFSLSGFIFLIVQYFQFLKGYGPLDNGIRLLPVAFSVAITAIGGTRLALRFGTKLVVSVGLLSLTGGYLWASTAETSTSYLTIACVMVLIGSGLGLTSAPATEAIMGVVPIAKAGVGSAVNDATRLLGSTLGVAVIGSVSTSLYTSQLGNAAVSHLPSHFIGNADSSIGAALEAAAGLKSAGLAPIGHSLRVAATDAFLQGLSAGCLVAAGLAGAGVLIALLLLPAQPVSAGAQTPPVSAD